MQLLTLPINSQDPDPIDICCGRNSSVHKATRNAVPVSGEIWSSTLNQGRWRHHKCKFIMLGFLIFPGPNSVLDTFPHHEFDKGCCVWDIMVVSGLLPDWPSRNWLFSFVLYVNFWQLLWPWTSHFNLTPWSFITRETRNRIFTLFCGTVKKITQPLSSLITTEYKFTGQMESTTCSITNLGPC